MRILARSAIPLHRAYAYETCFVRGGGGGEGGWRLEVSCRIFPLFAQKSSVIVRIFLVFCPKNSYLKLGEGWWCCSPLAPWSVPLWVWVAIVTGVLHRSHIQFNFNGLFKLIGCKIAKLWNPPATTRNYITLIIYPGSSRTPGRRSIAL